MELLSEFFNVAVSYFAGFMIKIYPMWKTRDVKTRSVMVFFCCFTLYLLGGLMLVRGDTDFDFRAMQLYRFIGLPLSLPLSFVVFRKRVWQNVFLIAVAYMYSPICVGSGMYAAVNWLAHRQYPLLGGSLVSLAVVALTLPPLLFVLRKLCGNPVMKAAGVWRIFWLLPALFFALFMIMSDFTDQESFAGMSFFAVRALIYGALLLVCYIFDASLRYIYAAEAARLEREAALSRAEQAELDLEKQRQLAAEIPPESLIVCGALTLNTAKKQAFLKDGELQLTGKEFELLAFFIGRENEVMTAEEIYQAVWGQPYVGNKGAFNSVLKRLRKKLSGSKYAVEAVYGEGYRFAME